MSIRRKSNFEADYMCSSHDSHVVALYCQSCDMLICPRCISQGPNSHGTHKDHVYLDLSDAYDLKKEQFEQVMANFKDVSETRKNERMELNACLQKLKFALLRKKTTLSRQTRSLHDAITKHQRTYERYLERLVNPAILRTELLHKEVDYETVAREGLMLQGECGLRMPQEKSIQFLRSLATTEKEMVELSSKMVQVGADNLSELESLEDSSLQLNQGKPLLARAFAVHTEVPERPHVLRSWCTVGYTSASIVFKYPKKSQISYFAVACEPYSQTLHEQDEIIPPTVTTSATKPKDGFMGKYFWPFSKRHKRRNKPKINIQVGKGGHVFKITKFMDHRVTAILRNLRSDTVFRVRIYAVNNCGYSFPAIAYFKTPGGKLSTDNMPIRDGVFFHQPGSKKTSCCFHILTLFLWLIGYICLGLLLIWVVYAVYLSHSQVFSDTKDFLQYICDILFDQDIPITTTIYETICPTKIIQLPGVSSSLFTMVRDLLVEHDWFQSVHETCSNIGHSLVRNTFLLW